MGEILTLRGVSDGSNTTGDFPLYSDLFYYSDPTSPTLTYIRIPKGVKAKIWCKRIAGAASKIKIQFTKDVTASSPVWAVVDEEDLASEGEIILEKRRPLVLRGTTGNEAFKASWEQSTAGVTSVDLEVELEE